MDPVMNKEIKMPNALNARQTNTLLNLRAKAVATNPNEVMQVTAAQLNAMRAALAVPGAELPAEAKKIAKQLGLI